MHETFCFWDFNEWKDELVKVGFKIHPSSRAFTNEWIVENRWENCAEIFELKNGELVKMSYPPTTMFLIGIKD